MKVRSTGNRRCVVGGQQMESVKDRINLAKEIIVLICEVSVFIKEGGMVDGQTENGFLQPISGGLAGGMVGPVDKRRGARLPCFEDKAPPEIRILGN